MIIINGLVLIALTFIETHDVVRGGGFLVKTSVLNSFSVSVLDDSHEGILWLKLVHKTYDITILPCVCYLPPENSSRHFDVNSFYDQLLTNIYQFQNEGSIFVCGDFNSRCGDLEDFIPGVVCIPHRHVVDYTVNKYGELLIDFLINTHMCLLNGRNSTSNDYTSISVKGRSVVDYCFVPYDDVDMFHNFTVNHVLDMIDSIPGLNNTASTGLPDHSLLRWDLVYRDIDILNIDIHSEVSVSYDKFNLGQVPENFMCDTDTLHKINAIINDIEQGRRTQHDIDSLYDSWCHVIKDSMYASIPYKTIRTSNSTNGSKRKRKFGKPWWSDRLTELWTTMCNKESLWLKANGRANKRRLKTDYVSARKAFDHEVQKAKRLHWYSLQREVLTEAVSNDPNFWKTIGRLGINQEKRKKIPMEVLTDDGTVSNDVNVVLEKWKSSFSTLFQGRQVSDPNTFTYNDNRPNDDVLPFNDNISLFEIKKAVDKARVGKAVGPDCIHTEVLKNDAAIMFMHSLFNVCFSNSIVPSLWNKCIINPYLSHHVQTLEIPFRIVV